MSVPLCRCRECIHGVCTWARRPARVLEQVCQVLLRDVHGSKAKAFLSSWARDRQRRLRPASRRPSESTLFRRRHLLPCRQTHRRVCRVRRRGCHVRQRGCHLRRRCHSQSRQRVCLILLDAIQAHRLRSRPRELSFRRNREIHPKAAWSCRGSRRRKLGPKHGGRCRCRHQRSRRGSTRRVVVGRLALVVKVVVDCPAARGTAAALHECQGALLRRE